jgi:DNA-binding sugar fermentation-stimulating protein
MKIRMKICLAIFATAWVLVHGGCATFKPPSIADVPFQERAQTQQKNGVRVSAAVLSEKESRAAFGVSLYSKGIQPFN